MTYAELNDEANRAAHAFAELGVGRGDVIAVMSPNAIETIVAYYGALKLGAAYTGLNVMYGTDEVRFQVGHAEPKVVVVAAAFVDVVEPVRREQADATFVVLGDTSPADGWRAWGELMAGRPTDEPDAEVDELDVALISYTSGTEASPKGVVIPHRNYLISTAPSWTWGLRVTARGRLALRDALLHDRRHRLRDVADPHRRDHGAAGSLSSRARRWPRSATRASPSWPRRRRSSSRCAATSRSAPRRSGRSTAA